MAKTVRIKVKSELYEKLASARDRYGFRSIQRMLLAMAVMLERRDVSVLDDVESDYISDTFDELGHTDRQPDGTIPVRHNNRYQE